MCNINYSSILVALRRQNDLQPYSQSRRPHGSRPFHDFDWYNSCWTEKCPLAANGNCRQERPPEVVLYGSRPYGGFVNRAVNTFDRLATLRSRQNSVFQHFPFYSPSKYNTAFTANAHSGRYTITNTHSRPQSQMQQTLLQKPHSIIAGSLESTN